jgi:hypothetical protein
VTPRIVEHLLTDYTNPHSAVRANGRRGWYYPARNGGLGAITCIGIHTTENNPSPATALNVARWQATTAPAPSSYHVLVDSDHIVRTLHDVAVAFHIVGLNTRSLGLSFGTRHDWWGRYPQWDAAALDNAAQVAAGWCRTYGIPVRWITLAEANRGVRGFIRHSVADPGRRRDPGDTFPAAEFFRLVRAHLDGTTAPAAPAPASAPTPIPEEDIMASLEDLERVVADAVAPLAATVRALAKQAVADMRSASGMRPDPESDAIWADRIAAGRTLDHARAALVARADEQGDLASRVALIRAAAGLDPDPESDAIQARRLQAGRSWHEVELTIGAKAADLARA